MKRLRCLCLRSILDVRFVCAKNKANLNWCQPSLQADPALTVKHWTDDSIMFVIVCTQNMKLANAPESMFVCVVQVHMLR